MVKEVIKYYADWCGPCRIYSKTFDKVAEKYKDRITFTEVNVDYSNKMYLEMFKIKSIPTTVFINKNDNAEVVPGIIPEEDLIDKINAK